MTCALVNTGLYFSLMRIKDQVRQDITDFLKVNGVMTLATCEKNEPWVCTVYYGIDEKLNMFIVTDPNSRHGKSLANNPKVAFNIFDSHTKNTDPKQGVQGTGVIEQVKGIIEVTKALILWHKANPGLESRLDVKYLVKKASDARIYKVTPEYVKFFNKQLYGSDEFGEVKL
jgi:uncharacterized protein YhbP (UPF0306 family)